MNDDWNVCMSRLVVLGLVVAEWWMAERQIDSIDTHLIVGECTTNNTHKYTYSVYLCARTTYKPDAGWWIWWDNKSRADSFRFYLLSIAVIHSIAILGVVIYSSIHCDNIPGTPFSMYTCTDIHTPTTDGITWMHTSSSSFFCFHLFHLQHLYVCRPAFTHSLTFAYFTETPHTTRHVSLLVALLLITL